MIHISKTTAQNISFSLQKSFQDYKSLDSLSNLSSANYINRSNAIQKCISKIIYQSLNSSPICITIGDIQTNDKYQSIKYAIHSFLKDFENYLKFKHNVNVNIYIAFNKIVVTDKPRPLVTNHRISEHIIPNIFHN